MQSGAPTSDVRFGSDCSGYLGQRWHGNGRPSSDQRGGMVVRDHNKRRTGSARAFLSVAGLALAFQSVPARGDDVRTIDELIVEQNSIVERYTPPPEGGRVSVRVVPATRLPAGADPNRHVLLKQVRTEGATLYQDIDLQPLWTDKIGQKITLGDLADLTERIEQFYRDRGTFAQVLVPAQDFSTGSVRIAIYDQSYISTVETTGDAIALRTRLAPYVERIVRMRPIRVAEVERVLLLMSDISGMDITAILRRPDIAGEGGSMSLEINFRRHQARVSLDNSGSEEIGPLMLFGSYQANDVLGAFEATKLTAVTVPNSPQELILASISQQVPIGYDGFLVGYKIAGTIAQPEGEVKNLGLKSSSLEGRIYASYPFLRTLDHSITGTIAFNSQNAKLESHGNQLTEDSYRWLSIAADMENDLGFADLSIGLEFRQGLDILAATGQGAPLASQSGARPDFQLVQLAADLDVKLSENNSLLLRTFGQYAFQDLPPIEQISFGGDPFGRAFDSSVASGDSGLIGSLQLSRNLNFGQDYVRQASAFGFVDYGLLYKRNAANDDGTTTLGSAGIGLKAVLPGGFASSFVIAVPVEIDEDAGIDDTGARLGFSVRKRF